MKSLTEYSPLYTYIHIHKKFIVLYYIYIGLTHPKKFLLNALPLDKELTCWAGIPLPLPLPLAESVKMFGAPGPSSQGGPGLGSSGSSSLGPIVSGLGEPGS